MPAQTFPTAILKDQINDAANKPVVGLAVTVTPTQSVTDAAVPVDVLAKPQFTMTDPTGLWQVTIPQSFTGAAEYIVARQGMPAFRVAIPVGAGPFIASANKAADSA